MGRVRTGWGREQDLRWDSRAGSEPASLGDAGLEISLGGRRGCQVGPLHGSVPLPMCPVWLISGRVGKSACFWPPGPTPEQPWVPGHILSYLGLYTPSKGTPRQLCGWEAPMAPGPVLPRPAPPPGVVWACPPLCPRGLQPALSGAWDLSCLGRSRPRRWPSLTVAGEGHISPSGSGRQGLVKTAGWPPLGPRSRDSCC